MGRRFRRDAPRVGGECATVVPPPANARAPVFGRRQLLPQGRSLGLQSLPGSFPVRPLVRLGPGQGPPRSLRRRTRRDRSAGLAAGKSDAFSSLVSRPCADCGSGGRIFRHLLAPWPNPGAAYARSDPVQAVRSALIRRMLVAVHTRSHSRATGHWPRRLNCRNPRTRLIQP